MVGSSLESMPVCFKSNCAVLSYCLSVWNGLHIFKQILKMTLKMATGKWQSQRSLTRYFFFPSLEFKAKYSRKGGKTLRLLNPAEVFTVLYFLHMMLCLSYCQMLFLVSTQSCQTFTFLILLLWASLLSPCIYFPSFISSFIKYSHFHYSQTYSFITFVICILSSPFSVCCC